MLVDEAHNDGETAWQILQRECDFPVTELELEDMKRNVRALTIIGTVGYHGHSISFFRRALTDENSKIPADWPASCPHLGSQCVGAAFCTVAASELCVMVVRRVWQLVAGRH